MGGVEEEGREGKKRKGREGTWRKKTRRSKKEGGKQGERGEGGRERGWLNKVSQSLFETQSLLHEITPILFSEQALGVR